jgi:hypothetical protein
VKQVKLELELDTHVQLEDTSVTGNNTTIENIKTIGTSVVIELYNARFKKLVPLSSDSKRANVYDHLITEEEITDGSSQSMQSIP